MVFPRTANYTTNLLFKNGDDLVVTHKAAGADMFRYSTNWESSWSSWLPYTPGNVTIQPQAWNGTKKQRWNGEHIVMQYWSEPAGSSAHVQHSDLGSTTPRRFPHLFLQGPFNMYGYDAGIKSQMKQLADGKWSHNFMSEWPAKLQFNVWGVNPDEKPDSTFVYGDIDGDGVLERTPPDFLGENFVNVTNVPPAGYISYKMVVNDGTFSFEMIPSGSRGIQIMIYVLFFIIPVLTGGIAVYVYMVGFYGVKTNTFGIGTANVSTMAGVLAFFAKKKSPAGEDSGSIAAGVTRLPGERNRVLIATLEYDIEDWGIKIKIGGLGVMAQLMGKSLQHQDLIWVVPCVNGVDYPIDTPAESMTVTIMEKQYIIEVQYHVLNNITYVLLDAPVFRKQTRAEPYPPRMDDLESAVFYSAWNQCIAEVLRRFTIDLYHINDFHGSLAPIHILPETIPCVLSLHNAEFQGMWPMRTPKESDEVCKVFNISRENCQKYVQFGDVFNLLHAGASYLRIHQKGYGAVGVSAKYGKRSWARYPIFWGLSGVGKLPNPDPTDTAEYNPDEADNDLAVVDPTFEAGRGELMRQAQEWAGLEQNPDAELLVFVGRWSNQKGVDLIADVAPGLLKDNPRIQLICVGPVIDLFGKFASLKLSKMMELYPGRVYSKPEFTALPAFIFRYVILGLITHGKLTFIVVQSLL